MDCISEASDEAATGSGGRFYALYVCVYTYIYIYIYIHRYVYIYIYIYIYLHTEGPRPRITIRSCLRVPAGSTHLGYICTCL